MKTKTKHKVHHAIAVREPKIEKVQTDYLESNHVTRKMVDDYLLGSDTKLTDAQKTMYYSIAVQQQLNPFKREIHAVLYEIKEPHDVLDANGKPVIYNNKVKQEWTGTGKFKMTVITGYEAYIKRGERTGDLDYWNIDSHGAIEMNPDKYWDSDFEAVCTIKRKSRTQPFIWKLKFTSIAPRAAWDDNKILLNAYWKKDPEFMVKKCCIAQAFRLTFSDDLGGMPYIKEELEQVERQERQIEVEKTKVDLQKIEAPKKMVIDVTIPLTKEFGAGYEGKMLSDCPIIFLMDLSKKVENENDIIAIVDKKLNGKIATMEKDLNVKDDLMRHTIILNNLKKDEIKTIQDKIDYANVLSKEWLRLPENKRTGAK